ncbi:hypothetical protein [Undibacterium sp. Tian12W]|uniref:hypothetical protein n=1 Tax=Undibacterium sp. Tian12W TaxID=3413054 RepID=UPI003BF3297D
MKIVYLDHHVVADQVAWPSIKALVDTGHIRVAISTWNIREIVQARHERVERAAFLESLRPLYIHDMLVLQRLEIVSFLNESLFGGRRLPFPMFTETFTEFLQMNYQIKVRREYQLTDYVRAEGDVTGDIVELRKADHVEAMSAMLKDPAGVQRVDEQTNHAKMATLIPRRNSKGGFWEPSQIADILVHCHNHRSTLLRDCPAILAEDALSGPRLASPTRKPRTSDTADLFHSVSALAYTDILVSNDAWALNRILSAKQTMQRHGVGGCEVIRSIPTLEQALPVAV